VSHILCGAKECNRRLPSQKQSKGGHDNNMNQSRTLYVPEVAGYVTESDLIPLFEELVELFVEIEQQKHIVVDGTRYDHVFIKVLIVADMMFLHKFTGQSGCCASTTNFCMFFSCMSKFCHQGELGGCGSCRRDGIVYDANGFQEVCLSTSATTVAAGRTTQRENAGSQKTYMGRSCRPKESLSGALCTRRYKFRWQFGLQTIGPDGNSTNDCGTMQRMA
jgi:hypothetical protein